MLAAIAVSKQPIMTNALTARVPHADPNASMKKPPAIGKMVFMIDTQDDKTPYRVLSMFRCCFNRKNKEITLLMRNCTIHLHRFFTGCIHTVLTVDFIADIALCEK